MATLEFLESETVCAICLSFFTDPVTTECGHSFCKTCILEVLRAKCGARVPCPECRSDLVEDCLRSDRKLANITEAYKQIAAKKTKPTVSHVCKQHQENLKLFCRMDSCPICVVCHVSSKHKGHEVMPIEEAVEQFKGLLTRNLSALRAGLKETTEYQNLKSKKLDEIKKSMDSLRKNVLSEFDFLHQLLNEEQSKILSQLDAEEKMSTGEIISNLKSVSEKSSSIDKIIKDIEERLKLQDADFLRDIHVILNRTGFDLQLPEEQTFQIQALSIPPYYLIWKKIKRRLNPPDRITPVLDQNTAHRFLILSKDKSTVSWKNTRRKSCNQESFNFLTAVLGREKFSSKKYVWTLEVDGRSWALGVVNKSVIRYGNPAMMPANGFWVLMQDVYGNLYAGNIPLRLTVLPNPVQLAVYLDYERGQLTIYRRDTLQHIYTFQYTFSDKLLPFFYVGKDTIMDLF